jgi:ribosomal protein S27E
MRGDTLVRLAIIVLAIVGMLEAAELLLLRNAAQYYSYKETLPVPSGYRGDGSVIALSRPLCYVIRLSADGCLYCKKDQVQYDRITAEARRNKCASIIMAPKVGEMSVKTLSYGEQLQYVDMPFGKALYPFITPETLVLSSRGKMLWNYEGAMDNRALSHALRAIRSPY